MAYKVIRAIDQGDFVSVTLNTSDKILIPLEDYFMMALKINSVLEDDIVSRYQMYQQLFQMFIRVKNRILSKDQTMYDIEQYCKKNCGLSGIDLETILSMVKDTHLIDDRQFALDKSLYWQQSGKSIRAIQDLLTQHGLSNLLVNEAIERLDFQLEKENAQKCLNKYKDTIKGKSLVQYKQALMNKMISKGFGYELSKSLCDSIEMDETKEYEALERTLKKAKRMYKTDIQKIKKYCIGKGFSISQINEKLEEELDD